MSNVFNVKTFQYANGITEVRVYSKPIGEYFDKSAYIHSRLILRDGDDHSYFYNPFTDMVEKMVELDLLEPDLSAQKKEHSLNVSFNRTRANLFKYLRMVKWEYFITLTFNPEIVDRYDFILCMSKAKKWINNQKFHNAPDLKYILVPEHHRDGAWHIHGVLADVGNMKFVNSGHKDKSRRVIYNLSGWQNGFSTATVIGDYLKVTTYITEYITKDLCRITAGKNRYYRSKNIPEPIEKSWFLEGDEVVNHYRTILPPDEFKDIGYFTEADIFIQSVFDSIDGELIFDKSVNGPFTDVRYIYFKDKGSF